MREIEKLPLSNGAVFITLSEIGKRCKTPKPPHFTKSGQESKNVRSIIRKPLLLHLVAAVRAFLGRFVEEVVGLVRHEFPLADVY
jgi:hypothetical protein